MTNQEAYEIMCDKAEKYDKLLEEMKKVSIALSNITRHEGSSYGYDEACDIADRYAEGVEA